MSIVTRGLSSPNALLASSGLGASVRVGIIVPIEQEQLVREILLTSGIQEIDLSVSPLEIDQQISALEFVLDGTVPEIGMQIEFIETALTTVAVEYEIEIEICETIK